MIIIKKGSIHLKNGSDITTVAVLNEGYTHIGIDDHCYVIINGGDYKATLSSWINPEALEALNRLNKEKIKDVIVRKLK